MEPKYCDSRMEAVRDWAELIYHKYPNAACAECGGAIFEDELLYLDDRTGDFYCSYCIEKATPLEEEGRVPEEFRLKA